MRELKIILLNVVMLTTLNASADVVMTPEDVEYFLNNFLQWKGCDSYFFPNIVW